MYYILIIHTKIYIISKHAIICNIFLGGLFNDRFALWE